MVLLLRGRGRRRVVGEGGRLLRRWGLLGLVRVVLHLRREGVLLARDGHLLRRLLVVGAAVVQALLRGLRRGWRLLVLLHGRRRRVVERAASASVLNQRWLLLLLRRRRRLLLLRLVNRLRVRVPSRVPALLLLLVWRLGQVVDVVMLLL